jgi:outer membrane protein
MGVSAQTRLTFDGALTRAMQVNNTIERTREDIGVAEAARDQMLSLVMPRITLNGDLTRNSIEQTFGDGDQSIAILPRNDWAYRVTLEQPVYAGRRELRAYSQAKLNVENARLGVRGTEDAALLRVASNYLAVVNADRRVDVERRNIERAERRLTQAQAFSEAGEVTKVDVFRAETAMKAAQRLLAVAQQQREHAEGQLRVDLDLDGAIEVAPLDRQIPPLPDEATLVARAESSRADIDVAENNVRIANLEVAKQRGYWLPTVRFDGGWIQQRTPFPANQYAYGALRFTVPIFQSGEVVARVAGAKSQERQAGFALDEAKSNAREDVRRALADLRSAGTGLQLATEQLQAAQAEYEQAFELYRAQEATSLDVAASEASLADARRAVAEETLNRELAELRVWFAAGDIKQAVGVTKE